MKAIICSLILLLLLSGCRKDENPLSPPVTEPNVTLGETINVLSQKIDPGGGTILIQSGRLTGMEIVVPANAFTEQKNFKISYAEITKHEFGQYFNPVSPAILISYEGGYSEIPIKVKVPIYLPPGYFAMGFFYNEKTGKLEGLPVESLDSNFIIISTRTFSTSSLSKTAGTSDIISLYLIINLISEAVLQMQPEIASGFNPGIDDWEFTNWGSYICPGGHCAGQSVTAMWYYLEKRLKGDPPLYHRFDKLNNRSEPNFIWFDNPLGYKYASTIQCDYNFGSWLLNLKLESLVPRLVFKAFAVSILLTSEPQSVLIRNSSGLGAHAMIVYKVNYQEGKLYIADPNYPNNQAGSGVQSIRIIEYAGGTFKTYETGLNAGGGSIPMDQIGYFGKESYISFDKTRTRWAEVENKTIGNTRFPEYQLKVQNDNNRDLVDQYVTDKDTIKFYCKCPGAAGINGTDHFMYVVVYDSNGNKISKQAEEFIGVPAIALNNGLNRIGIFMRAAVDTNWCFLDFKWINITRHSLSIEPNPLNGILNNEYTFTANTYGTAPVPYRMVWNFDDNTPEVTIENDSTVKHTFTSPGTFTIKVKLFDQQNNKKAEAQSQAVISAGDMNITSITYSGYIGDTVKIRGYGFGETQGTSYVTFYPEKRASIIIWSNNEILTTVPDSAETGCVKVFVLNKSDSADFIVKGNLFDFIKWGRKVNFELIIRTLLTDSSFYAAGINFSTILDTVNPDLNWSGKNFSYQRILSDLTKKITGTVSDDGRIVKYFKCEYFYSIPPPTPTEIPQLYMEERGFTVTNVPYHNVSTQQVSYELDVLNGLKNNISNIYWNRYYVSTNGYTTVEIDSIDWSYNNRVYISIREIFP